MHAICASLSLKTLINIVEAPFEKLLYGDVQMDQQPGIQKFWNLSGLYQDIYD